MVGGFTTTLSDGCPGNWWFALQPTRLIAEADPFRPAVPGELPPVVLIRGFRTTMAPSCPLLSGSGEPDAMGTLECASGFAAEITLRP